MRRIWPVAPVNSALVALLFEKFFSLEDCLLFSFPHWGKAGMGASLLLVEAVCLLSGRESGLGPTADPISFASPKEMGERKGEPAGGLSGETHCAPASLRSDSRRKFEFLCRSTPVLRLACGVAQALRLELPLPQAGEGTSSRIEKDFSSTTADSCCHQRHIQKQEPNQPLTPIQQALPAIKIEKNFSQADSPAAGLPTYPLPLRPWPGNTKTCADCGCC